MKNNPNTRTFAEAMGQAMAFGISIVTCDVFNQSSSRGFIHRLRDPKEVQIDVRDAFTMDTHLVWRKLMYDTETIAYQRGHTPCTYGTVITRNGNRVFMYVARHLDYIEDALTSAENEMTESAVYNIQEPDVSIYLQDNDRVPGTDSGFWEGYKNYEHEHVPYDGEYNARRASRIAEASTRLGGRL